MRTSCLKRCDDHVCVVRRHDNLPCHPGRDCDHHRDHHDLGRLIQLDKEEMDGEDGQGETLAHF